jgi:hypothetical protein
VPPEKANRNHLRNRKGIHFAEIEMRYYYKGSPLVMFTETKGWVGQESLSVVVPANYRRRSRIGLGDGGRYIQNWGGKNSLKGGGWQIPLMNL